MVVLAITLLSAIGLFAAHTATLVDQASGYARLARQTQHLAEHGTLASAAELGSGSAEPYFRQMLAGTNICRANAAGTTLGVPCYKMFYADLNARTELLSGESLIDDQSGDSPGYVGYTSDGDLDGIVGDFVVELTDPGPTGAPIAGTDLGSGGFGFRYAKITATTTAHLRPPGAECTNSIATQSGQQSLRAHLVIGPLRQ